MTATGRYIASIEGDAIAFNRGHHKIEDAIAEAKKLAKKRGKNAIVHDLHAAHWMEGGKTHEARITPSGRVTRYNPAKRINYDKMVPKASIDFIIGNFHVGDTDEKIEADLRRRIAKVQKKDPNTWPAGAVTAAVKYALKRHHLNQGTYADVMSGSLSSRRRKP